jgi:hypothetical protein
MCVYSTELEFLSVPVGTFREDLDRAASALASRLPKLRVLRITDTISRVAAQVFLAHLILAKRDCEGPMQASKTDPTPALCEKGVTVYWCC